LLIAFSKIPSFFGLPVLCSVKNFGLFSVFMLFSF